MKSAVFFIVAFLVATAGAAGVKVMLTPPHAPAGASSDSTEKGKDSTQTDTAIVASGAAAKPPTPDTARTAVAPVDSSKLSATNPPSVGTNPATNPATNPSVKALPSPASILEAAVANATRQAAAANDTATIASERRLAKVFTSMEAKQAAKVLEHMADEDVQIILGYVGPRQAATILAALPPERVATLSKLAMQGKK